MGCNSYTNERMSLSSPLYVRKDAYTCEKIQRKFGIIMGPLNPNDPSPWGTGNIGSNPYCPNCNIGFVGINAIIPEEQLHVIGNVKCEDGVFLGDISTNKIYSSKVKSDPDGVPFSGDEEYEPIEFKSDVNGINFTASNNMNCYEVHSSAVYTYNIGATNISTTNLTTNSLTNNGDLSVKGIFRVKNSSGTNVFRVDQNGNIRSRKSTVDLLAIPDYVFKKDYKLMSLKELEEFIKEKNHLPNIKSEEEYQQEGGIDLGELNVKLLEKVEELTLHLIEQNKKIEKLEALVNSQLKK